MHSYNFVEKSLDIFHNGHEIFFWVIFDLTRKYKFNVDKSFILEHS